MLRNYIEPRKNKQNCVWGKQCQTLTIHHRIFECVEAHSQQQSWFMRINSTSIVVPTFGWARERLREKNSISNRCLNDLWWSFHCIRTRSQIMCWNLNTVHLSRKKQFSERTTTEKKKRFDVYKRIDKYSSIYSICDCYSRSVRHERTKPKRKMNESAKNGI